MAARRATRFYDQALAPSGLGIAQFGVMNAIRVHAGGTVTDIARRLDMDRTTLTRNLRPLVRAGLVTIAAGRDDRARALVLTDAGAARLNEAVPYWRAAQARVAATLGAAETHALNSLLALALDRLPDV
ncbi:MAG: MarR family winged helix-turn-helix transcriptional regulator [Hyphomicrobiaceae bacterium]